MEKFELKFGQKLEKPLEKLPIARGEEFKPEEEVKAIRSFPREEQQERLKEFKEKLAYQKEGLGEAQEEMIKTIRANPDMPFEQLYEKALTLGEKFGMNEKQKELAKEILQAYTEKHTEIKKVREKYPDDKDLYATLFGEQPKGKIEVIEGPMTLYFRCRDIKDYARIRSGDFEDSKSPTPHQIRAARITGGTSISSSLIPGLRGTIIAENSGFLGYHSKWWAESKKTLVHEEQHAIKMLFQEKSLEDAAWKRLEQARTLEERHFALAFYMRKYRQDFADSEAKNEILAFFRSGENASDTFKYLVKPEGLYDYLGNYRESILSWINDLQPGDKETATKIFKEIYMDEYRQLLRKGVDSIYSLNRKFGYSKDKAVSVLIHEPLHKWEKVIKRLTERKKK